MPMSQIRGSTLRINHEFAEVDIRTSQSRTSSIKYTKYSSQTILFNHSSILMKDFQGRNKIAPPGEIIFYTADLFKCSNYDGRTSL